MVTGVGMEFGISIIGKVSYEPVSLENRSCCESIYNNMIIN